MLDIVLFGLIALALFLFDYKNYRKLPLRKRMLYWAISTGGLVLFTVRVTKEISLISLLPGF